MLTSSLLTFNLHKKETVVTEQLSIKPLKIVNPKSQRNTGVCMLTNYGGGLVEGDKVQLKITCKAGTKSIVSSQANTRIYESTNGVCQQNININLEKNAFHVFLNDPLVIHKGGNFIQKNDISIEDSSVLVFSDWFSAGRIAYGEKFAFKNYETSTKVQKNSKAIIWDNFQLSPETTNVYSPGSLNNHTSFLNLFIIGKQNLEKIKLLESKLNDCKSLTNTYNMYSNMTRVNANAFICRFTAENILPLKNVINTLCYILNDSKLLNYNPLDRKY